MKTCKTCFHWGDKLDIEHWSRKCRLIKDAANAIPPACDYVAYSKGVLYCTGDFGCVLHEPNKETTNDGNA
jgi:hypothetical protein